MSVSEPVPPPARAKATTIAAVVIVLAFIAGLLIGVVGDRVWMFHFRDRVFGHGGRGGGMTRFIVARLDRELQLSAQQKDEVTRILDAHRQRIDAITAGVRPQVRREIDQSNAEIEKILTPDQRTKFEKMKMRMLPRRNRNWAGAPDSMPMPPPIRESGPEAASGTPAPQPPAETSPRP